MKVAEKSYAPIKLIIWDSDGVFYNFDEAFQGAFRKAMVDLATLLVDDLKVPLSKEEAHAMAVQSFKEYGSAT